VLAVVLALASALGYGSSDYVAGLATRATSVVRVSLLEQAAAMVVALLIVPFVSGGVLSAAAAAWGAASGVTGVAGAMVLYLGFRNAEFSVASTLSAVGSAALAVVAGLLFGERPGVVALAGIVLAIPAIAAVSASPAAGPVPGPGPGRAAAGRHAVGVAYGLVAGVCFALYFISLNRAGSGSGLWPVLVGQFTALFVALCISVGTRELWLPEPGARLNSALTGATAVGGTIFFFVASHDGLLAVTAVITALYPGVTILLARILLGERLTKLRVAGLCLAGASVALIAVAGTG
jgi:drug/metabolite transporter (DMT)-like permease